MPDPTRWPGRKIEPAPDPTASRVGSGSGRVGSGSGRVGPGLCKMSGSFGFFGFRVKIFSPCPARQSYRVKNFDPSPPIKLFGSGRVGLFSGGLGQVRRVGQPMPRSTPTVQLARQPFYSTAGRGGVVWVAQHLIAPTGTPTACCIEWIAPAISLKCCKL